MSQIYRASTIEEATGRTLEGVALRYERPSRVTDDQWRTSYLEEFARGSSAKTLADSGPIRPLLFMHKGEPFGDVEFIDSADALLFRAVIEESDQGDQYLADIDQHRDVSVGGKSIRTSKRQGTPEQGQIVRREEIALRELSLVPSGLGLTKGAEVELVRAAEAATPRLDALKRRRLFIF